LCFVAARGSTEWDIAFLGMAGRKAWAKTGIVDRKAGLKMATVSFFVMQLS